MPEKPYQILVIEDSATDVLLIGEALREHGVRHEMTVLHNGEAALTHLTKLENAALPDLVILDLHLPKYDGLHVLAEYRRQPELAKVPIVVFSSSDSLSDKLRAKAAGVTGFLRKPLDLTAYLTTGKIFRRILETGDSQA